MMSFEFLLMKVLEKGLKDPVWYLLLIHIIYYHRFDNLILIIIQLEYKK